jgi:multidrug resistance efflux pump
MKLAQLQQAQSDVIAAQAQLDQSILQAPFSGIVSEVDVVPGDYAAPGRILLVVSDLNNLQVETTDLSELDISKVKIGNPASILIDALNQEFAGKVITISPVAQTLGGDVVYKVTLAFDELPEGALGGMTAEVNIGE